MILSTQQCDKQVFYISIWTGYFCSQASSTLLTLQKCLPFLYSWNRKPDYLIIPNAVISLGLIIMPCVQILTKLVNNH